jgi:PAS domain S-box-containing protein
MSVASTDMESRSRRPRVVLAEHDAGKSHLTVGLLETAGHEVQAVTDGDAALAAIKRRKPDIVVADMVLPRLNGLGLIAALRRDPSLTDVPVIIVSETASDEVRAACLRAGADDYLARPYTAGDLLTRLASHLASSRLRMAEIAKMSLLQSLSHRLIAIPDLTSLLDEVLNAVIQLQGADFGNVQLYDPETRSLSIVAQRGFGAEFMEHFRIVTVDDGSACAKALGTGMHVIIEDVMLDAAFEPHRYIAASAGFRAVQSTPLVERCSGMPIGIVSTHFRDPHPPGLRDLRWTDLYALQAGDVIALRLSEERSRKSEARLQAAVDLSGLSLYSWNPLTGALQWDASTRAIWGLPPDAHVNQDIFLSGIHPEDRPLVDAAITRTIDPAGDGLYRAEYRVIGIGDNVERWVCAYGQTSFNKGKPVQHLGAVLDITERKRTEAVLREDEERFRQFAQYSTDVLRIVDLRTMLHVFISRAFERVWGEPIKPDWPLRDWFATVHPTDLERVIAAFESVQEGDEIYLTYRIVLPDGRIRGIRDTMFPIRDGRGRVGRVGGSAQDITHPKGSQVYLVDADLTSRLELAEMLRGAGHEVKCFASARAFLRLASVLVPGCVIVDARRAEAGNLAIPQELKSRRGVLPVIMIAESGRDARSGVRAMKAGAADFLSFPFGRTELLSAVATELAEIQESTAHDREAELAKANIAAMSLRERQVLDGMLAAGTSKSIAKELGLSPRTVEMHPRTVEMHRARMMERLGVGTLLELVLLATSAGLKPLLVARAAGPQEDVEDNEATRPIG